MLSNTRFSAVRIIYAVIGCLLILGGVFAMASGAAKSQAPGVLMIALGAILFFEIRLGNVERRLRRVENKKD